MQFCGILVEAIEKGTSLPEHNESGIQNQARMFLGSVTFRLFRLQAR